MLTLEKLRVEQGDWSLAADLAINAGSRVAVLGPSGGGKSTLLNTIAGFLAPTTGRILWRGEEITATVPAERPISMIFQDNNLFPHLSAYQNVALGVRPDMKLNTAQKAEVSKALGQVGLDGFEDRKPAALSGGQQSRVALARVLVQARPLLLLDEPFAALGPSLRAEMLDLVQSLVTANGATLLMVTHDPADALRIADEVIYVEGGTVFPPEPTNALMKNPPLRMQEYLGS